MSVPWQIEAATLIRLRERLDPLAPTLIVECGSGVSTVYLGRWAADHDARVLALEHLERFAIRNREWCDGLPVEIRLAELGPDGFYDTGLPDGIDFALIDGPPGRGKGRMATLPNLWPHLADNFEVWLDDANRPHEQACLQEWRRRFPIDVAVDPAGHGVAVITP